METAVITPRNIPYIPKRSQTLAKPVSVRVLDDDFFISLTKEIQEGAKKPSVSRKEVLNAIESERISPDVVEDLEDAILGRMIEESLNSERASREQVMKSLRRR